MPDIKFEEWIDQQLRSPGGDPDVLAFFAADSIQYDQQFFTMIAAMVDGYRLARQAKQRPTTRIHREKQR